MPRIINALIPLSFWATALLGCPQTEAEPELIPSSPSEELIASTDRECDVDQDCIVVLADCCRCSSAGAQTSINKTAEEQVQSRFEEVCSEALCNAALSDDETCCAEEARCIASTCELFGVRGLTLSDGC